MTDVRDTAATEPAREGRDDEAVLQRHRMPGLAATEPAREGRDDRELLRRGGLQQRAATEPAREGRDDLVSTPTTPWPP